MATVQENKHKVRPVMNHRELNEHVDTYKAGADVCAHKSREWRRQVLDVAVLDLRWAYLQIHIERSQWPFQTVEVKGTRYCLSRLGFGLNVAPNIMMAIMNAVRAQDENIQKATSSYIDDVFVNERKMLIRRPLAKTIKEYLVTDVALIKSAMNKSDALTRVPQRKGFESLHTAWILSESWAFTDSVGILESNERSTSLEWSTLL